MTRSLTVQVDPAAVSIAEAQKYAKEGQTDVMSLLGDAAERTASVVTDVTVLAGIGSMVKSIQDPDRYGTRWLSQQLLSLVPAGSALNTVGQASHPLLRRSERTDVGTRVTQNLQARVPGLRENVPAALDPLGRDLPNPLQGATALNPFRPTTERDEPTLRLLLDHGVDVPKPRDVLTVGGRKIDLQPAEQREFARLRGEEIERAVAAVQQHPEWSRASREDRAAALKQRTDRAGDIAARMMLNQMPDDEILQRRTGA